MRLLICLFLVLISFSACEKAILGEDEVNTPENNFELFWTDFEEHYAFFEVRNWNWDSIYQVYRPMISPTTTEDELWSVFSDMIAYLDDSHTFIYNPDGEEDENFFASGDSLAALAVEEFSLDLVKNQYVTDWTWIKDAEQEEFAYGKIKDKPIGYIYLAAMDGDATRIDEAVDALYDYEAIIFDIRNNGGGDDEFSARIAGAFADSEQLLYTVESRNGPNHSDFSEKTSFYSSKAGPKQYLKPVIVLTDAYTVSAADVIMIHLKSFEHITQIGTATAGDFSDSSMIRFLPNGWVYQYSTQIFLLADGTNLDGIGHIPDIYSRNTPENIQAGEDVVLQRSFQFLKEAYGIE